MLRRALRLLCDASAAAATTTANAAAATKATTATPATDAEAVATPVAATNDKEQAIKLIKLAAKMCDVNEKHTKFVVEAFKEGATIPFLARYRRDRTGDMDETKLKAIQNVHMELVAVESRRQSMVKSLKERSLLTPQLEAGLASALTLHQLDDLYEPFKVQRVTLASKARELGFAPVAEKLLNSVETVDTKDIITEATSKLGEDSTRHLVALVAETFTIDKDAREALFNLMWEEGEFTVSLVREKKTKAAQAHNDSDWEDLLLQYESFDGKASTPCKMGASSVLAFFRGEAKGALRLSISVDGSFDVFKRIISRKYAGFQRKVNTKEHQLLMAALEHSLKESVSKSVALKVRRQLKEQADTEAIAVFAHNLRRLLLQRPLKGSLLAMDPGFRHGIKCVILDESGSLRQKFVLRLEQQDKMEIAIKACIVKHGIRNFAVGDGTATRETQIALSRIIKQVDPEGELGVQFAAVSEAGASVYSVSELAREEFPDIDVMYRGAISIGRRLQDPLSELIKIPVQSIGVGIYQHDVQQRKLMQELSHVAQSIVSIVGINIMTASTYVIRCIPGMKSHVANSIVAMRKANQLKCREDLKKIPGVDAQMYEQIGGFLRFPESENWLDNTNTHPESYEEVLKAVDALGLQIDNKTQKINEVIRTAIREFDGGVSALLTKVVGDDNSKKAHVREVLLDLQKTQLDPRNGLKYAGIFRTVIVSASDMKPGDIVTGVVQNVTPFGVFVDIGVEDSALLIRDKELSRRDSKIDDYFTFTNVGDVLENLEVISCEKVTRQGGPRWQIAVKVTDTVRRVADTSDEELVPLAPLATSESVSTKPSSKDAGAPPRPARGRGGGGASRGRGRGRGASDDGPRGRGSGSRGGRGRGGRGRGDHAGQDGPRRPETPRVVEKAPVKESKDVKKSGGRVLI